MYKVFFQFFFFNPAKWLIYKIRPHKNEVYI